MRHFQVKVCGVTRPRDAELAAQLGADMIGLIFYSGSPRRVSVAKASAVARSLPPVVDAVGVFVNEKAKIILGVADKCRLNWVQLHGDYTPDEIETIQRHGVRVIQAFRRSPAMSWRPILNSPADLVMIDNSMGSGKEFEFKSAPKSLRNLVLSGGVSTSNLEKGIRTCRPLVVDVNSSVEIRPGIKSRVKMTRFFRLCNELRYGK